MSKAAQAVIDSALKLTEKERDLVIDRLMGSFEAEHAEELAFRRELRRRIEDVESGKVKPIPWEVGRQMIVDDKDVIPH